MEESAELTHTYLNSFKNMQSQHLSVTQYYIGVTPGYYSALYPVKLGKVIYIHMKKNLLHRYTSCKSTALAVTSLSPQYYVRKVLFFFFKEKVTSKRKWLRCVLAHAQSIQVCINQIKLFKL